MAQKVVGEGRKAIERLGKKLKELAKKQNAPVAAVLGALGSVMHYGSKGLQFIEDHFWWFVGGLTIIMFLGTIELIYRSRKRSGRVRVKVEEDDE